ncbi:DUF2516 family protein [Aeromicrobium terrae]|uniref:DUF2516 family protein n=1 Tax=Aeromicrobium terrae TaxID=2498846 RepID=A0A5C8NMV9_9ACTN|nr:DUF2516 family protein [Aeromicrobium terrae]TXL62265.1 DUF2516 family protein [Aeromicrobium terrae]
MFEVQSSLALVLTIVLFVVKLVALVDCVARGDAKFVAVGTWPRTTWLVVLGLTVAVHAIDWNPLGLLNLVGTVAALVYLAQLRGSS